MFIRITSKTDGFWRAGLRHPAQPTDHPAESFTPEQLAALKAEPMLTVEEVEGEQPAGTPSAVVVEVGIESLKQENQHLQQQLDEATGHIAKLLAQIEADTAQSPVAPVDIQAEVDRLTAELRAALDQAQADNTALRDELAAAFTAKETAEAEASKLKAEVKKLKKKAGSAE